MCDALVLPRAKVVEETSFVHHMRKCTRIYNESMMNRMFLFVGDDVFSIKTCFQVILYELDKAHSDKLTLLQIS